MHHQQQCNQTAASSSELPNGPKIQARLGPQAASGGLSHPGLWAPDPPIIGSIPPVIQRRLWGG
eukprot:3507329-Alexandrium_andersonii.AAC.1